jgi:putative membrane protein
MIDGVDAFPLVAAAAALGLAVAVARRSLPRALALTGAAVALAVAGLPPITRYADHELLLSRMAQLLLIGDLAPLLIAIGAPPALLERLGPLLRPWVTLGVWAATLGVWHVPQLYDAAAARPGVEALQQASFLLAGVLVWTQVLDPAGRGRLTLMQRAGFAAIVLAAGMPLANVLVFAPPLYHRFASAHRPFGLTAAGDQSRAALLMMAEQALTLGTAAALLLWSHADRVQEGLAA